MKRQNTYVTIGRSSGIVWTLRQRADQADVERNWFSPKPPQKKELTESVERKQQMLKREVREVQG